MVMVGAPVLDETSAELSRSFGAGRHAAGALWARAALIDWKAETRLPLLKQPVLVLRPQDNFWEAGGRVAKFVPGAKVVDLPEQDKRLLETQPSWWRSTCQLSLTRHGRIG